MDFKSYLGTSASQIQGRAVILLKRWEEETVNQHAPVLTPHINLFTESVSGGKGLRGTLVKLGYELTGHRPNNEIIDIAAAIEIVHTALLIQDDIMDKSHLRRGKPSVYSALGNNHYGVSQAICLGDLGLYFGMKVISESKFSEEVKNKTVSIFTDIIIKTVVGQMLDVHYSKSKSKNENEILAMYLLKTAQYTFVGPLLVGAILGNAPDRLLAQLQSFGENLGLAYQIQDDILGCFGDEVDLGKSVTLDIREGKNTLLFAVAYEKASSKQRKTLTSFYGKRNITPNQCQKVKEVLEATALRYCQEKAIEYIDKAYMLIPTLTTDKKWLAFLENLCQFLAKRNK